MGSKLATLAEVNSLCLWTIVFTVLNGIVQHAVLYFQPALLA